MRSVLFVLSSVQPLVGLQIFSLSRDTSNSSPEHLPLGFFDDSSGETTEKRFGGDSALAMSLLQTDDADNNPEALMVMGDFPNPKKPLKDPPYISGEQCAEFAGYMENRPKVNCKRISMNIDTDACMCEVVLPPNVHPVPDIEMSAIDAPEAAIDPAIDPEAAVAAGVTAEPGFEPIPLLPAPVPPVNNAGPYAPPHMVPHCPYAADCGGKEGCVGFHDFGFSAMRQSKYSAAAKLLNTIHCMYVMPIENEFKVPERVAMATKSKYPMPEEDE